MASASWPGSAEQDYTGSNGGVSAGISKRVFLSRFSGRSSSDYGTKLNKEDLKLLSDLMANGKVTPVIDRTYKLSETAEAMRYFEEGHARGKIVITVEQITSKPR